MLLNKRQRSQDVATPPAQMTAADQLRALDEQAGQLASHRTELERQAEEERVAAARKGIRQAIDECRAVVSAKLSRQKVIEDELDTVLNRATALADEVGKTVDQTAALVEDAICRIKALGADAGEVEAFRNSIAPVVPASRSALYAFRSNKQRWREAMVVDFVDRAAGDLEHFRFANRLVLVIEKP